MVLAPTLPLGPGSVASMGTLARPLGAKGASANVAKRTLLPVAVATIVPEGTVTGRLVRLMITTWPLAFAAGSMRRPEVGILPSPDTCALKMRAGTIPAS